MALVLADRVKETTTTAGTGTITLAGAVTGYQSFAVIGNGNTTYYTIAGQGTSEWEVGIGTYTSSGTTLTRTTVLASSNGGALVPFSAGIKDVFVTYPAGKSVNQDASGKVGIGTTTPAYKLDVSGVIRGTSDALINGATVGLGSGSINVNVAFGTTALFNNTSGYANSALGYGALFSNTTGGNNTAVSGALYSNTTGSANTGIGYGALVSNSTASGNSAVGYNSLYNNTTGTFNTALGYQSGYSSTTASAITAIGYQALQNNTGYSNTALGAQTLFTNTTGAQNTALGSAALYLNTTGSSNVAIGYYAGFSNTTASNNTAVGYFSMQANTTGNSNVAVGAYAMNFNTTGAYNTAVGYYALSANTTPNSNTAVGYYSLAANTTGYNNTAVGYNSLLSSTTGANNTAVGLNALTNNTTAGGNSAFGSGALQSNTTGAQNTAIGTSALLINSTGNYNTVVGYQSLYNTTTGYNNVALGWQSGYTNSTGAANTFIGSQAGYFNTTGVGNTFIGNGAGSAMTTGSTNVIIGNYNGNQSGLDIRINNGYIVLSDGSGSPRQVIDSSGNTNIFGSLRIGSVTGANGTVLYSPTAANLRLGGADAAAPVGQILSVQNVVTGTTNTAGANFTINGSQGTGTGVGGNIFFLLSPAGASGTTQNSLTTALTLSPTPNSVSSTLAAFAGQITVPNSTYAIVRNDLNNTGFGFFGGFPTLLNGGTLSAVGNAGALWVNQLQIGGTYTTPYSIVSATVSGKFQFGGPDSPTPVAQRFGPQSAATGNLNVQGPTFTINGSQSTGNQPGGDIVFQVASSGASGTTQNPLTTTVRMYSNRTVQVGASYLVAALPTGASASQGARTWVTDAASATYSVGATVTGGGTNVIPVFFNGTAWVAG